MDLNILIRDLPPEANHVLNTLATLRSTSAKPVYKWEVIRDALIEYADKHKHEIATLAKTASKVKI